MDVFLRSKALLALTALFALSGAFGILKLGALAPQDFPFLSWTGWTIQDFLSRTSRPNIVFLGSSLMLVPLDGVDADYLNRRIDGSQHHRSEYFEHKLEELAGRSASTFTFALPGEMPSDAYLIVNNLLNGEKRPDLVIYGVGPRDFLDNLLPSPSATDPYRYLSRFGPVDPLVSRVMPEWTERLNYELGKLLYVYGHRENLSRRLAGLAEDLLRKGLRLESCSATITPDDRHLLLPDYRPCEVGKGQAFFRPTTREERANFVDNIQEYRKRYAKLKWDTYLTQMGFLADTLETARARGIKVLVVAMPLTDLNRKLLSRQSWAAYSLGVAATASAKGAAFLDLSDSSRFTRSDFGDTVHLHSGGGKILLDMIAGTIASSPPLWAALQPDTRPAEASPARPSLAGHGGQL